MKGTVEDVLLIDAGNTRLKWGRVSNAAIIKDGEVEIPSRVGDWAIDTGMWRPARVVVACVAGDAIRDRLVTWSRQKFGVEAECLTSPAEGWGITSAYQEPEQLGIDRWAAMVAAFQKQPGNLCVIDAGSALTLDFIRADGRHRGGFIVPGLKRLPQCLVETTSLQPIPAANELPVQRLPGISTADCIRQGALQMLCGLIETSLQQYEKEVAAPVHCILTGGDAAQLATVLKIECELEPDLVLQGIGLMADNEAGKS